MVKGFENNRHGQQCQRIEADQPRCQVVDTKAGPSSAPPPRALPPSAGARRTPSCNVSAPSGAEPARIASAADDDMDGGHFSGPSIGPDDEDALERQECVAAESATEWF